MKYIILVLLVSAQAHAVDADEARLIGPGEDDVVKAVEAESQTATVIGAPEASTPIAPVETRRNPFRRPPRTTRTTQPSTVVSPVTAEQMQREERRAADNRAAKEQSTAGANRWAETERLKGEAQRLNSDERKAANAEAAQNREQSQQKWQQTAERQDAQRRVERAEGNTKSAEDNYDQAVKRKYDATIKESELYRNQLHAEKAARAAGVPQSDFDPKAPAGKADRVTSAILGAQETRLREQVKAAEVDTTAATAAKREASAALDTARAQEAAARADQGTVEAKQGSKLPAFAGGMNQSQALQSPEDKANRPARSNEPGANGAFSQNQMASMPNFADYDPASKTAREEFRCISGGVIVMGKDCKPARSMSQNKFVFDKLEARKVKLGDKTVDLSKIGCALPHRNGKGKIVRSTDPNTGLCEPMRYGLSAEGRALCAKPDKNHSQGCANAALVNKEASLKWAKAIIAQNPKASNAYATMQSRVCDEKEHHRENGRFSWSTDGARRDDVGAACGILDKRTADLGLDIKTYALNPGTAVPQNAKSAQQIAELRTNESGGTTPTSESNTTTSDGQR